MSSDPRLPDLFGQVAELAPARRDAWLAELRTREPVLAVEIAALLAAGERRQRLLDSPEGPLVLGPLAEAPADGEAEADPPPPERIGPYRIVREIGRGGMGRVFLAEEEGEHFRRRVALKVLERGDLGTLGPFAASRGPAAVRRFREEVRILASLEHPGIARFLDGGRAADGTWFLALEYVEGVGLLEHARSRSLGVADRLRLFLAVLDAVAYAHERLVVHRDLKPANVLVGVDGQPRLLDFGIAKLVDPEEGDETLTRTELRAFTPAYASPEQFRGERATPASDVYSLGVVLYELLAGVRPYRTTSSSRAELERAVLEEDPEPPSTAARRAATRSPQTGPHGAAPPPPPLRLGADLDAICLRALRKEPRDRYRTVKDFAADLRRHLAGQPVEARRGGMRYRAGRFVTRHRSRLGMAAALVLALGALLYAARTQQHAAEPASAPAPRATVAPTLVPKPFPFSRIHAPPVAELERRFAAAPESVEAGAGLALGLLREGRLNEAELVVTRLRQIPGKQDDPLSDYVEGVLASRRKQPQRALVLQDRALAGALRDGRGELVGQIRATRGPLLSSLGQRDMAVREMTLARADFERAGDLESLARVLNDLAIEELTRGRLAEGEKLLEAALAATQKVSPSERGATFHDNLGAVAMMRGRPDLAEPHYREAVAAFRETGPAGRLPLTLGNLASALRELGKPGAAKVALDEAIALAREAGDKQILAHKLYLRGDTEVVAGRLDGVDAIAGEIAAAARETADRFILSLAETLSGSLAAARGDTTAARRHLAEALRAANANGDDDSAMTIALRLAELERRLGNDDEAVRLAERARGYIAGRGESAGELLVETTLARVATDRHELPEARRRLAALTSRGERAPSVELRLAFLTARAALLGAERRLDDANRDVEAAIAVARPAERKLDELELRLLRAELRRDEPGGAAEARVTARAVAEEASRLGLRGIATRARALLATPSNASRRSPEAVP